MADSATLVGGAAADLGFDDVEPGDTFERLAGDRCGTGRGEFVEAPAHMGPAERQFNVTALGQDPIAGIAVDLEDAGKTREVDDRPFGLAIGSVDIGDGGRVCAAPGPVVAGIMRWTVLALISCRRPPKEDKLWL